MSDSDIYELLDRAYESEDIEEITELVERALALDPDNPEALLFLADLTEEDEERLPILEKALENMRLYLEEEGRLGNDILEDEMGLVYLGILQRTAFTLFSLEEDERSLELVEELLQYDHKDQAMARTLFYRILLERQEWSRALEETMKDSSHTLGWAYTRMIASFMLSKDQKIDKLNKMLWEAIQIAPNAPFYMLGYIPDPVDESEEEAFHFSLLFEGIWSISRDLLNWFSKATILFGLLSGRFGKESEDMTEILNALNGGADLKAVSSQLKGSDHEDSAVINALLNGNYPSER